MPEPVHFRCTAYGYDYTWEVEPPGLQVDADQRPFVWARPVRRHPCRKRGYLRGRHVFHLSLFTPETVEFFRRRVMRPPSEQ